MKNIIYVVNDKNRLKKIKEFPNGQLDNAMSYAYKLAYQDRTKKYKILTEDDKMLKVNTTIII
jgi:hypothetical protein